MKTRLHRTTSGTGPPLVFVHGMADDSSIWDSTVAALTDDFTCTRLDLPGHGVSPAPEEPEAYAREALLESIDDVLDEIGPAIWIGHSLGGYLGLAHAITRPNVLRGLVLVATGPGFRDAKSMENWNNWVRRSANRLPIPEVATISSLHVDSMVIERFSEIAVPVGLVLGSHDRAFLGANDYMQRKLSNVTRDTVEGGRHRLMRTHSSHVADMARDIWARAESAEVTN